METTVTPKGRKFGAYFAIGAFGFLAIVVAGVVLSSQHDLREAAAAQATADASMSAATAVEAAKPPTVQGADKSIYKVHVVDGVLQIHAKLVEAADETGLVDDAGALVHKIGVAIQNGAPELGKATKVVVHIDCPEKDRLGNVENVKAISLGFSPADFKKAQWANLNGSDALNLVQAAKFDQVGRHAVTTWCAKPENRAPALCKVAG